jgi:[acyl-carrier-protein] S-malonyltransferase
METEVQQPALVATSLAINAALRARGINPDYVVGHSVGEYAALGAAESYTIAEALRLVRERGLATAAAAKLRPGSMAAILGLADDAVEALCRKIANVWPANYNCPGQLVVSGETDAVDECCAEATAEGARRAVRLRVSGAFHSPLVAHAAERLKPAIDKIEFKTPKVHFVSTVTAKLEDAQRYRTLLVEQLTAPVKFTQAAREMVSQGVTTFVEVGPGNVLSGLLKRIDSSVKTIPVNDLASLDAAAKQLA